MFGRDNYDEKENYKRDRENRLEHIENLNRKAQDEFNHSFFNRSDKLYRGDDNYIHEDEHFTYHGEDNIDEVENSKFKKIILAIFAIGALGFLGYFGFNNTNNKTSKASVEDENSKNISKDINSDSNIDKKSSDILEISPKKIISSETMESPEKEKEKGKEEPLATRTPEPIITPNAENKIVKVMGDNQAIPKPTPKSEEESKSIDSSTEENIKKSNEREKIEQKEEDNSKTTTAQIEKPADRPHKTEKKSVKKPKYKTVTVKKGDTLASLAERYYGNPMDFKRIVRANRDIRGSHSNLHPGQKIIIPIITHSKNARLVRVRRGDTLYSIAKRYYGSSRKYQKIIDANYKIKNIHTRLYVGEVIRVPR